MNEEIKKETPKNLNLDIRKIERGEWESEWNRGGDTDGRRQKVEMILEGQGFRAKTEKRDGQRRERT